MTLLVAVEPSSNRVVGTVAYKVKADGDGHIRGMAVSPESQGSGVAQMILERVESDLRNLGCHAVTLDTTAPLARAVGFYVKHGFRATGDVGSFFGMPLYTYRKQI